MRSAQLPRDLRADLTLSTGVAIAMEDPRVEGDDAARRARVAAMLAEGLETQTEPFPGDSGQFEALRAELGRIAPEDLRGRLVLAGFTAFPQGGGERKCGDCMYYLVHRRWCDLPQIDLPVEEHWSCRLWRV